MRDGDDLNVVAAYAINDEEWKAAKYYSPGITEIRRPRFGALRDPFDRPIESRAESAEMRSRSVRDTTVPQLALRRQQADGIRSLTRTTTSWRNLVDAVADEIKDGVSVLNLQSVALVPGATLPLGEAVVTPVAGWPRWDGPGPTPSERLNAISIVVRLEYRGRSVLFTWDTVGRRLDDDDDACKDAEQVMVAGACSLFETMERPIQVNLVANEAKGCGVTIRSFSVVEPGCIERCLSVLDGGSRNQSLRSNAPRESPSREPQVLKASSRYVMQPYPLGVAARFVHTGGPLQPSTSAPRRSRRGGAPCSGPGAGSSKGGEGDNLFEAS